MQVVFKIIGILIVVIGLVVVFSPEARKTLSETLSGSALSSKDVQKLIKNDMQRFSASINNKSMAQFHAQISDLWQARTSVQELNEVFAPFINSGIDLTILNNGKIVIDKGPIIIKNSDLHAEGHYERTPLAVNFKVTYHLQKPDEWKLSEFFIEINNK